MMKYYFFIFFLFNSLLIVKAQYISLPEDSSVWHYQITDFATPIPNTYPNDYSIIGDTIINNINYVKLYSSFFAGQYAFRQDSIGRIYTRNIEPGFTSCNDTSEFLLYDFSLYLNDTFYVHGCTGNSEMAIVINEDSVLTNLGYRKRLTFAPPHNQFVCSTIDTMTWIESIGSKQDFFYNINFYDGLHLCLAGYKFLSLDKGNQNVIIISNINNNISQDKIIYIDGDGIIHSIYSIEKLEIFDIYGRKIYENNLNIDNFNIYNLDLNNSILLISLMVKNKNYVLKYFKK